MLNTKAKSSLTSTCIAEEDPEKLVSSVPSGFDELEENLSQRADSAQWNPLSWLLNKGDEELGQKRYYQAIPVYEKLLSLSHGKKKFQLYAYLRLAQIYLIFRDFPKLKKNYLSAISLDPDNAELRFQLGEALVHLDRNREAIAAYRSAVQRAPKETRYHLSLATCLSKIGRFREANETYQNALQKKPSDVELLKKYSLFLIDRNQIKKAEVLLEKAIEVLPDDKDILFTFSLLKFLKSKEQTKKQTAPVNQPKKPVSPENDKTARFHHAGFSYAVREDIHWVDDGERRADYEDYLTKDPNPKLSYGQWREYDDEYLRLIYWLNLRDLDVQEQKRFQFLKTKLLLS